MNLSHLKIGSYVNTNPSKLPSDTLAALQDFYHEREKKEKELQDFRSSVEQASSTGNLSMNMFAEDWNASQFWVSYQNMGTLHAVLRA